MNLIYYSIKVHFALVRTNIVKHLCPLSSSTLIVESAT